ncbi:unnamed protein product [Chrysoparadoxa australica]
MMEEEDQDMMDEHQKDDLPIAPNGYDGGRSTHNADFGRVGHNCRPFQPKQPQHHVGPVVSQGTGALLTAAGTGDLTTVQKLLAGGMPADARDEKGQTPLSLAARRGHAECAQSLLAAGADVDGRAGFGRTPLLYAACEGRLPMVQLLLRHKATIGVRDAGGDTALIWASYGGHEQCAMALLGAGADVNARDHHGGSALHHAAARGLLSLVQHLLYNMANPDLPVKECPELLCFHNNREYLTLIY